MSTSFEARFSATGKKLPKLLERLEAALQKSDVRFFGSVMQLESHEGWPTVSGLGFDSVETMADLAGLAENGWGVGLECVSDVLLEGLGRTDAVEVYFNIFRTDDNRWTVSYLEGSDATDFRAQSDAGARNLSALQAAVCHAGGFDLSIYDEQNHERSPVPTLRDAEVAIKRAAADPTRGDLSVAVSSRLMTHERAQSLAGRRADQVKVSVNGYVLFPFLAPMSGPET